MDKISTVMLKYIAEAVASPLTHIISKSFHYGTVPSALKLSRVIPVFKSGNKEDLINYRPISLLLVLSKVFEKLEYIRMISLLIKIRL